MLEINEIIMKKEFEKLRMKNSKMHNRFIKLLDKLNKMYCEDNKGNGNSFSLLMNEFDVVRWSLHNIDDEETKKYIFYTFYFSYKLDGNKYHKQFDEFYKYISKYSFNKINGNQKLLFRSMTFEEFELSKIYGNLNPSWSEDISKVHKFATIKVLTKECKKSIIISALYKSSDIIFHSENDEEKEYVVKINSKPISQIQVFNFHLTYIKKLYNINSDNPFINPEDINNGYTWIESLKTKGIILKSDNSLVNQYCNLIKSRLNNNFNNCINII